MFIDIYIVRDQDFSTVEIFTSEYKALYFTKYNKKTEMEHTKVYLPSAATREVHHINLKEENEPVVKTMKQLIDAHISYVVFDVCKGNIAKSARMLDMSDNNLRHKLKQMEK